MLTIRKSTSKDIPDLMKIFSYAQQYMKDNGNPTQWGYEYPTISHIENDIKDGNSYIIFDGENPVGTFFMAIKDEPTYAHIDGKWLNDNPYAVIHRIASNGQAKGVFDCAIKYTQNVGVDIRIDTHQNNLTMRHLFDKYGFQYCGIIVVEDGTERIAYQKISNRT